MARRNRKWNEATIDKKIKEGHGQGEGVDYRPWYTIYDFNSIGIDRPYKGKTVPREHHLLSNLEFHYFLLLDWSDSVVDIRERFPLLDVEETARIAESLNISHPSDKESGTLKVFTSDFLIVTKINGEYEKKVRTLTYSKDLIREKTIQRFEIERMYWTDRNIDWGIVTEKEIPMAIVKNLIWIDDDYHLKNIKGFSEPDIADLVEILEVNIQNQELSIFDLTKSLDNQYNTETGTFLHLFKHLVSNKRLRVDISKPIEISKMFTSEVEFLGKRG